MGRVSRRAPRRSALRRPLLLFAVLLLGPAAGFCLLGWKSVVREQRFRVREMQRSAQDLLQRRLDDAVGELERIRQREDARDYFEYQAEYLPPDQVTPTLGFQKSPLDRAPEDPRVAGWFQWELHGGRVYGRPRVFPEADKALRRDLVASYGAILRKLLMRAPHSVDLRAGRGRVASYTQRVVAANEERGALQEDLELQERGAKPKDLRYLEDFNRRAREDAIQVRYTPFRYLVRPAGAAGPPLIAWRTVWIPAAQIRWREVKADRWIVQGYAIDPHPLFPDAWESLGAAQVVRGDRLPSPPPPGVWTRSLARALRAEVPAGDGGRLVRATQADPSLTVASRADVEAAAAAWRDARNRFLLLVAGLVVVVAVGFFVLVRSVRRETLLARRKEDFIAAITHELKTPLTGIRMYADMLREGWVRSPEAAGGYAQRILDETDRLGRLVDQVLDLAALERGVAVLNAQPGDLGEAVRDAAALLAPQAEEAGVSLATTVEEGLPVVSFDPRLVRPLVLNLVDNAIKYSARAAVKEVLVGVRREGDRVVVSVADRGVGIDPKVRKAVFEPFQRAGDEMTRAAPGVGIGLALVKRYADAHNARLHLSSEPGRGTTVEVRFRLGPA
jgi:signal transduction histidine kinase